MTNKPEADDMTAALRKPPAADAIPAAPATPAPTDRPEAAQARELGGLLIKSLTDGKPNVLRLAERGLRAARLRRAEFGEALVKAINLPRAVDPVGRARAIADARESTEAAEVEVRACRDELAKRRADWAPKVAVATSDALGQLQLIAHHLAEDLEAALRTLADFGDALAVNGLPVPGRATAAGRMVGQVADVARAMSST